MWQTILYRRTHCWPVIALCLLTIAARAQQTLPPMSALDSPVDARSVGMGESFAGVPGDGSASFYNPAGLGWISGIRAGYGYRSGKWIRDLNQQYYSGTMVVSTPLATIGVLYHRSNMGPFDVVTLESFPSSSGSLSYKSNLLTVSFARVIAEGLSAGVSIKGFDEKYVTSSGDPGLFYESQGCFLFDLGIQYTAAGLFREPGFDNVFTGGISIQNFGTDLKEQMSIGNTTTPPAEIVRVPRYVRVGISYVMTIHPGDPDALTPLKLLLSGAYRGLLNPTDWEHDKRDYWGWGLEAAMFECVTLRMGSYLDGAGSVYGAKATPALRYGAGLALPITRLGVPVPLTVRVDYAAIPLQSEGWFSTVQVTRSLPVYTVGVTYEGKGF